MTLFDLFQAASKFLSRHPFPVYVEGSDGELYEVDKMDFRSNCAGVVLITEKPLNDGASWDEELIELRDAIAAEYDKNDDRSPAWQAFNPTGNVLSIEAAYRLLNQAEDLLSRMYEQ